MTTGATLGLLLQRINMSKRTEKRHFRVYGKEGKKLWKLMWASQGPMKDIQYNTHITGGISHTSVHLSGQVHQTTTGIKRSPDQEKQYPWTLDSFLTFDRERGVGLFSSLNSAGIARNAIRNIPLTRKLDESKEHHIINLDNFPNDMNFWHYLVKKEYAQQVAEQMQKEWPGVKIVYPKQFNPTLLIVILDAKRHPYGKLLNLKAKENTVMMRLEPSISVTLNLIGEDLPKINS